MKSISRLLMGIYCLTPIYSVVLVVLFIVSNISFLLALILPWKILLIVAADGGILLQDLSLSVQQELQQEVAFWAFFIVFLLIFHLLCEALFAYLTGRAADSAIDKSKKIGVFNNYREFSKQAYRRYIRLVASLAYSGAILLFFAVFYPELIIVYIVFSTVFLLAFYAVVRYWKLPYSGSAKWLPFVYKTWWHLGFVFALLWVIYDYWQGRMPSLIMAYVCLFLFRRMLMMNASVVQLGMPLYDTRVRTAQVFSTQSNAFHQIVQEETKTGIQSYIDDLPSQAWLNTLCSKYIDGFKPQECEISCRLTSAGKVAYVTVTRTVDSGDGLMVKIFSKNREAVAEQEFLLTSHSQVHWPFLYLLERQNDKGYTFLTYRLPAGAGWLDSEARSKAQVPILTALLECQLPVGLVAQYGLTHAGLWARLDNISWQRLRTYAGEAAAKIDWQGLEPQWQAIVAQQKKLPCQLVIRGLADRLMLQLGDGDIRLASATGWAWEPIGAGWPLRKRAHLAEALATAAQKRPELADVGFAHAFLNARLFEFERRYRNKNYVGAINVLINLLAAFDDDFSKEDPANGPVGEDRKPPVHEGDGCDNALSGTSSGWVST